MRCGLAQGTEKNWVKVGYPRNRAIEDRRARRDGTVGLAGRTALLTAKTTVLSERNADG